MNSSGDFDVQNFQSIIDNYEAALRDVTEELDSVQDEQKVLKRALSENTRLSNQLQRILAEHSKCQSGDTPEHKIKENALVENLRLQVKVISDEKNQAIKLWQNACIAVENLESELRMYQDNTQGLVPKSQLTQLKKSYEEKLNELEAAVAQTKARLEETINLKTKELQSKDKEITGTLQSQDKTFKIVKNLEDEVLNLQKRLSDANSDKLAMEKSITVKNKEIEFLKVGIKECKNKVAEALQVVEAALNEKDAALLREAEIREDKEKLTQTLTEFIQETDNKIKQIKTDHERSIEQLKKTIHTNEEVIRLKNSEMEVYTKKCSMLEDELEKIRNVKFSYGDDSSASKMLILEKNLESTFQKLLLSEKQNIQLKSEMDAIKADLDQMSHYYERDVNAKESENAVLKNEIRKLKKELDESLLKVSQSKEAINSLNKQISTMEFSIKEQIKETKSSFQQTCLERQEMETVHKQIVQELQEQLLSQTDINKKWRAETKTITEQLEKIIKELKLANTKIKQENKMLHEKLKDANLKMLEYRKFLELISHDVGKITTVTLSELGEGSR